MGAEAKTAWHALQQHLLVLCTMWRCQNSLITDAEQVMLLPGIRLSVTIVSGTYVFFGGNFLYLTVYQDNGTCMTQANSVVQIYVGTMPYM